MDTFELFFRLILSAVIGGVIGIEREASNRPAGFRTHILVSVGSTLIMLVSIYGVPEGADPARIAAQVVSGVGFLGAGTILRTGSHIKGLTTAASLWVCAGIGLAIGSGFYLGGIITAIIVILSLVVLGKFEKNILRGANKLIIVNGLDRAGLIGDIGTQLGRHGISIRNINIEAKNEDADVGPEILEIKFYVKVPMNLDDHRLFDDLYRIKDIKSIEFDSKSLNNK